MAEYVISCESLKEMLTLANLEGRIEERRLLHPDGDLVSQNECKRILFRYNLEKNLVVKWTRNGLIHPIKTGDRQMSRCLYSVHELLTLINAERLKAMDKPRIVIKDVAGECEN